MSDCMFCSLTQHEKIAESEMCVAVFDRNPVNPGHALIIPKRHVESFFDMTPEEVAAMYEMILQVKAMLDEQHKPDGYNVGVNIGEAAGQSVYHVHMHLIPRFTGDMEYPRGGVRGVIPEMQNY